MAIRVVARIRPPQQHELDKDVIVTAVGNGVGDLSKSPTLVKIPSLKNDNEIYTFSFSSVYDRLASQQSIFDGEGWSSKIMIFIFLIMIYLLMIRSGPNG